MVTMAGLSRFFSTVVKLESFPVFVCYLLMVVLARYWKRIAKPIELQPIMVVYNFVCSALSVYTLYGFASGLHLTSSHFEKSPASHLVNIYFWYMTCKRIELLDTVFMILRHRERQLSFLHIYHHSSMLLLSDYAYHYTPWPALATYLAMNSLVHVVLYLYYGLSALNYQPPWKKQMTQLQIIQFLVGLVFSTQGYLYHGYCIYSIIYGVSMTALFGHFYFLAYHKKKKV